MATIVASRAATKRESWGCERCFQLGLRHRPTKSAVRIANMRRLLRGVPLSPTDASTSCFDVVLSRICSEEVAGGSVCLDCTSISISLFMIKF